MSAAVHTFPFDRRPVPRNTIATVDKARRSGAAADFYAASDRRDFEREQERANELNAVRSAAQLIVLAVVQSLSYPQRKEVSQTIRSIAEKHPEDGPAQAALWLMEKMA